MSIAGGGCSLIYDSQIAERLCTAAELRKTSAGRKQPNEKEQWLDTQERALFQAELILMDVIKAALAG